EAGVLIGRVDAGAGRITKIKVGQDGECGRRSELLSGNASFERGPGKYASDLAVADGHEQREGVAEMLHLSQPLGGTHRGAPRHFGDELFLGAHVLVDQTEV